MGLSDFESRLERGVEGVFGRLFRSGVKPVELGRKLVREVDRQRTVGVSGQMMAPNHFVFHLSPDDHEALSEMESALRRELSELVRSHAREERYRLAGPVDIGLEVDDRQRSGLVRLQSSFREAAPGEITSFLVLPDDQRVPLGDWVTTVGRHPDSTIVLSDPNSSRQHLEVRPNADGFTLVDLGSTNGTKCNGVPVTEHQLIDGDRIQVGRTVLRFALN